MSLSLEKGAIVRTLQNMSFRSLNQQKAGFLSPLYNCLEFHRDMFLRQHWSIFSLAAASWFAYVLHLHAFHFSLLSLPCLEWLLVFFISGVNVLSA